MEGKKMMRWSFLAAKLDYKKAYVTLRSPLSLNPSMFHICWIQDEREWIAQASFARSKRSSIVEENQSNEGRSHWLDDPERRQHEEVAARGRCPSKRDGGGSQSGKRACGNRQGRKEESKFPWSSMRK